MAHPYLLYVIFCYDAKMVIRTYVGITNNFSRRIQQHRGILVGGAKYTTKYTKLGCRWKVAATAHGFKDWNEVLKFEWALQHPHESKHLKNLSPPAGPTLTKVLYYLFYLVNLEKNRVHIWCTIHKTPELVKRVIIAHYSHKFFITHPRLLKNNDYSAFISYARQIQHDLPVHAKNQPIDLTREETPPPAKVQHPPPTKRDTCKRNAEYYRELSKRLLEQAQ